MNLKELQNTLKAHFESDGDLPYVEAVSVRKYTKKSFPAFKDYCIIISPKTRMHTSDTRASFRVSRKPSRM